MAWILVRHARIAKRADEDGVEVALQHGEAVSRNGGTVFQVSIGRPVKGSELNGCACGFDNFQGCGNNLFADTVTWDDGNSLVGHGNILTSGAWLLALG